MSVSNLLLVHIAICVIHVSNAEEVLPGNLTDFMKCKVSHLGMDYQGDVAKTEGGVRCQSWSTEKPVHKIDIKYTDDKFPDGSRKEAKNYCRNPNHDVKGPWCYTMDATLSDDSCGIPLCSLTECKITGPGIEYAGELKHAVSDRKCLKWNKDRNKIRANGNLTVQKKFDNYRFPDGRREDAKKFCRNPDGDIGGPWCFVEMEDTDQIEREYCNVPFCDDKDCMVFTKDNPLYSHYTIFDQTLTNITFGIKLWDPDGFLEAHAKLVLSILALPVTGKEMGELGTGIELSISNQKSALTVGSKGKIEYEASIGILKATEYTFFSLSWSSGFISLNKEGETKPLFLAEYDIKNNLLGLKKDKFKFYSAQGNNVLWSFPFCDNDFDCDVHTTTTGYNQQFWPLRQENSARDLKFYIRGFHSASVLLLPSPTVEYPRLKLELQQSADNNTRILVDEYPKGPTVILFEMNLPNVLNFWEWHEFSLSIFADTMHFYWTKDLILHTIAEIKNDVLRKLLWFSPSSNNAVAHWTFFCNPPKFSVPPPAWLPECALTDDEKYYNGTQDVTSEGLPCVPWSGKTLRPDQIAHFNDKEKLASLNYCRDPGKENKGTYCYALNQAKENKVQKTYCRIRKCKSAECRMAGTGNDYIGKVNTTRTNRTCRPWFASNTSDTLYWHQVPEALVNNSLYADLSVETAKNFCRNPSRNIAGSWCYTTDQHVPVDVCNVRDCSAPEECTIITQGHGEGAYMYILPQWKETGIHGGLHFSIKQWDPDLLDSLQFMIKPMHGDSNIELIIGADNNQKIVLYYNSELVKEKTLPHLISSGKWSAYWLQIREGEILLGYEGVPSALFEWKHENPVATFVPMFLTYMSLKGRPMGVHFKCDECHTENTTDNNFSRIMPIGLWTETESTIHNNLTLKMRGTGTALIPLMLLPGTEDYYELKIRHGVSFTRRSENVTLLSVSKDQRKILTTDSWTEIDISFNQYNITVTSNGSLVFHYQHPSPMLFYWFSVGAIRGWVSWTANCDPLDIDGPPRDGGWSPWSPWQCTVSCGGGEGFRTRTCSNPRPNIFGQMCQGTPTSVGVCNDFECGDISPDTVEIIREHLQTQQFSLKVKEGDSLLIKNNHKILNTISVESPDAYYEWTLNGLFVNPEKDRVQFVNDDIQISKAELSDTGTYVCMMYRINKQRIVIRVVTVVVITKDYSISTRATLPLTLKSNAVVMGYIYSDLRQRWTLNKKIYIDYGITTLAAVTVLHIDSLNMSHTGEWECIIEQYELNLLWVTNSVKVEVKKEPNLYTHLMEDSLTAPLFSWLETERNVFIALIVIIVTVVLLVLICLILYLRYGTLPQFKRKYQRNRLR